MCSAHGLLTSPVPLERGEAVWHGDGVKCKGYRSRRLQIGQTDSRLPTVLVWAPRLLLSTVTSEIRKASTALVHACTMCKPRDQFPLAFSSTLHRPPSRVINQPQIANSLWYRPQFRAPLSDDCSANHPFRSRRRRAEFYRHRTLRSQLCAGFFH